MSFLRGVRNALPVSLLAWAGLLASCSSGPDPIPLGLAASANLEDTPVPARQAYGREGRFRVIHASACDGPGGNPLVWPDRTNPPTVGRPLRVTWTVRPSKPLPEAFSAHLLVSFGDVMPIELPAAVGYPGCTLHVNPNPRNLRVLTPAAGSILTRDAGRVFLDWTPPPALAGVEVNCQLLVWVGGRWRFSPGLELWIGHGDT